jgi:hypothetical protein
MAYASGLFDLVSVQTDFNESDCDRSISKVLTRLSSANNVLTRRNERCDIHERSSRNQGLLGAL